MMRSGKHPRAYNHCEPCWCVDCLYLNTLDQQQGHGHHRSRFEQREMVGPRPIASQSRRYCHGYEIGSQIKAINDATRDKNNCFPAMGKAA